MYLLGRKAVSFLALCDDPNAKIQAVLDVITSDPAMAFAFSELLERGKSLVPLLNPRIPAESE